MFSRYRNKLFAAALLALLLSTGAFAAPRGPALRVCLLTDNLPYSERSSDSGFDVEVARAAALKGGRELKPVWIENQPGMSEIDDSDFPLERLDREACDAIFSMPGPATDSLGGNARLTLGAAYYGAAFELLSCAPTPPGALAQTAGSKVAIQSQTVAHFALLAVGAEPVSYFSLATAYKGLLDGEADAALLWGPAIGWQLRRAHMSGAHLRNPALASCTLVKNFAPSQALRWNMHVATRTLDKRLRGDIDAALATMMANGELDEIKRGYGLPLHAPFGSTYNKEVVSKLRQAH